MYSFIVVVTAMKEELIYTPAGLCECGRRRQGSVPSVGYHSFLLTEGKRLNKVPQAISVKTQV